MLATINLIEMPEQGLESFQDVIDILVPEVIPPVIVLVKF